MAGNGDGALVCEFCEERRFTNPNRQRRQQDLLQHMLVCSERNPGLYPENPTQEIQPQEMRRNHGLHTLHDHQAGVLEAIAGLPMGARALSVLCTGSGKTAIMVAAHAVRPLGRTLIVCNNTTIREELASGKEQLVQLGVIPDNEQHLLGVRVIETRDTRMENLDSCSIIISSAQLLTNVPRDGGERLLDRLLAQQRQCVGHPNRRHRPFITTIIFDEAHHAHDDTQMFRRQIFDGFCAITFPWGPRGAEQLVTPTFLFFTATPYTAIPYNVMLQPTLSLAQAQVNGIVRDVVFVEVVAPSAQVVGKPKSYKYHNGLADSLPDVWLTVQHILHTKNAISNRKHKAIVAVRNSGNGLCEAASEYFTEMQQDAVAGRPRLSVDFILGEMNMVVRQQKLERFKSTTRPDRIDVLVMDMLLNEGFSCKEVSVIAFLKNTNSKFLMAQSLGRAVRLMPVWGDEDNLCHFVTHSVFRVRERFAEFIRRDGEAPEQGDFVDQDEVDPPSEDVAEMQLATLLPQTPARNSQAPTRVAVSFYPIQDPARTARVRSQHMRRYFKTVPPHTEHWDVQEVPFQV